MSDAKYHAVNSRWPETLPDLEPGEAISAAKRLYRRAMGRPWKGTWKLTSGRRFTWPRRGVFYVNPKRERSRETGWHDLVHMISHYCHRQKNPGQRPHAAGHESIERDLVLYVREQGWLDGRLRRPEKAKPDVKAVRYERVVAGIARWETKLRRAETALRKLKRQRARYERLAA